jgi:hypothetical protein
MKAMDCEAIQIRQVYVYLSNELTIGTVSAVEVGGTGANVAFFDIRATAAVTTRFAYARSLDLEARLVVQSITNVNL